MDIAGILDDLATCLCAQILTDGLPPVCACGVMPGSEVALDYAGDCEDACGMAWVRLTSSYPSVSIGQPTARPGNCSAAIGIEVELGIMRCIDLGDGTVAPDLAEMTAAAVLQYADMLAMWRAIACCQTSKDWVLGTYIPHGPQGGILGGIMPLAMLVI